MNEHVLGVWELEALCYPSTNDRYQSNGINESTLDNNPKLSCIIAKLEHMVGLVWEKKIEIWREGSTHWELSSKDLLINKPRSSNSLNKPSLSLDSLWC